MVPAWVAVLILLDNLAVHLLPYQYSGNSEGSSSPFLLQSNNCHFYIWSSLFWLLNEWHKNLIHLLNSCGRHVGQCASMLTFLWLPTSQPHVLYLHSQSFPGSLCSMCVLLASEIHSCTKSSPNTTQVALVIVFYQSTEIKLEHYPNQLCSLTILYWCSECLSVLYKNWK